MNLSLLRRATAKFLSLAQMQVSQSEAPEGAVLMRTPAWMEMKSWLGAQSAVVAGKPVKLATLKPIVKLTFNVGLGPMKQAMTVQLNQVEISTAMGATDLDALSALNEQLGTLGNAALSKFRDSLDVAMLKIYATDPKSKALLVKEGTANGLYKAVVALPLG
jgi:hypothetical protein